MHKTRLLLLFLSMTTTSLITISQDKTLMISIPKCGTHLMINALEFLLKEDLLDWPADQFSLDQAEIDALQSPLFGGHILYTEHNKQLISKNNFTLVLMIRDPRDQCVSMMYWLRKHPMSMHLARTMDDDTLLMKCIIDPLSLYPETIKNKHTELKKAITITDFYYCFLPWMHYANALTIRFEELVGSRGNGSAIQQEEILNALLNHLHITTKPQNFKHINHYLFGHSTTFRKGQIGSWKTHFNTQHKKAFKEVAGQLLIDLGYEKDMDW